MVGCGCPATNNGKHQIDSWCRMCGQTDVIGNPMNMLEIVMKLIGNTRPVGCSTRDEKALENFRELEWLVSDLVEEMRCVSMNEGAQEHSVNKAGVAASTALRLLAENIEHVDALRNENIWLRERMTLAECQHLGSGGNCRPDEVVESMRKILNEALTKDRVAC